ncbi:helix-turn-helix domain-containing protein, partial [Adlercreutzia equolifaciens]
MYDRDTIELALLALEEGMSQGEAAELAGVARTTVGNWERGRLPHARSEKRAHRLTRPPQRAARMSAPDAKEGPLNEVERAAYEAAMTENMLLRAVLDDLKGAGSHPASMSNRRKCELGERLRAATGRPLREITAFLRISRSSYEYWRARLSRPDKYAALRGRVRELFEEG